MSQNTRTFSETKKWQKKNRAKTFGQKQRGDQQTLRAEMYTEDFQEWLNNVPPLTPQQTPNGFHNRDADDDKSRGESRDRPQDDANPSARSYSKYWCFTSFRAEKPTFTDDVSYAVYQLERSPTTGREHYQGYVEFTTKKRLHSVQQAIGDEHAHCELRKGSRSQAIAYCKKQESRVQGTEPFEHGDCPVSEENKSQLQQVATRINNGATYAELCAEYPTAVIRYDRGLKSLITQRDRQQPMSYRALRVLVLSGPPGCGKTKWAFDYITKFHGGRAYHKSYTSGTSSWWDGYDGQRCILVDDFEGTAPIEELLHLLGGYGHNREYATKGGFTRLDGIETVIFTTNSEPTNWYGYRRDIPRVKTDALLRRITEHIAYVDQTTFTFNRQNE